MLPKRGALCDFVKEPEDTLEFFNSRTSSFHSQIQMDQSFVNFAV